MVARNKCCVSANLRVEQRQPPVRTLIVKADILIENFKPGTLERRGLGPEVLHQIDRADHCSCARILPNRALFLSRRFRRYGCRLTPGFRVCGIFRDRAGYCGIGPGFCGFQTGCGGKRRKPDLPPRRSGGDGGADRRKNSGLRGRFERGSNARRAALEGAPGRSAPGCRHDAGFGHNRRQAALDPGRPCCKTGWKSGAAPRAVTSGAAPMK